MPIFFKELNKYDKGNDRKFLLEGIWFFISKSLFNFHEYKYRQNKSKIQEQKEIPVKPHTYPTLIFFSSPKPYNYRPFFPQTLL